MVRAGEMAVTGIRAVSPSLAAAGTSYPLPGVVNARYGSFSSIGGSTTVSHPTVVADESYDYAVEEACANQIGGTPKADGGKPPGPSQSANPLASR